MGITTSKIVFVNNDSWHNRLYKSGCDGFGRFCRQDDIVLAKKVFEEGAASCLTGNVMNPMNKTECAKFHFNSPDQTDIDKILAAIQKLSTPQNPPNILISGGAFPWEFSERFYRRVTDALNELKQNFSVIWGQKDFGTTNIFSDAEKNLTVVNHNGCEINNLTDLKNVYQEVSIVDGHEVLFGEDNIPPYK